MNFGFRAALFICYLKRSIMLLPGYFYLSYRAQKRHFLTTHIFYKRFDSAFFLLYGLVTERATPWFVGKHNEMTGMFGAKSFWLDNRTIRDEVFLFVYAKCIYSVLFHPLTIICYKEVSILSCKKSYILNRILIEVLKFC